MTSKLEIVKARIDCALHHLNEHELIEKKAESVVTMDSSGGSAQTSMKSTSGLKQTKRRVSHFYYGTRPEEETRSMGGHSNNSKRNSSRALL